MIASFLVLSVIISVSLLGKNIQKSALVKQTVLSAKTTQPEIGLKINVKSSGSWDLLEYLCKTKTECSQNVESGRRTQTISGGASEGHEVLVVPDESWTNYTYLKVYIKPSWGAMSGKFSADQNEEGAGEIVTFNTSDSSYEVFIVETEALKTRPVSVDFSN